MKKKIIKKIILVIIPIMVFCIGMNDVKAISYIGENYKFSNSNYNECVDSQECILLCGYEQELDGSNTNVPIITYGSVYIYYFQSGRSSDDIKVTFNSNKSDLLQYNNNKIEWDGGTLAKTKNSGLCPTYGYSFNGDVCFSNDKSFCEEKFNSKLPLTSVKKYDIKEYCIAWYEKEHWDYMKEIAEKEIDLEEEIRELKEKIAQDKYQIREILKSKAFRLGRLTTKKRERIDLNKIM